MSFWNSTLIVLRPAAVATAFPSFVIGATAGSDEHHLKRCGDKRESATIFIGHPKVAT